MYTKTMIRDDDYLGGIYERITWIVDEDKRSVRCKIAKYDYTNRGKILDHVLKGEIICSPQDNWDPVVGELESWGKAMITGMHYDLQVPNGKSICTPGWGRFKRWAVDKDGCEIIRPAEDVVRLRRYLKKEQKAKDRGVKIARESFLQALKGLREIESPIHRLYVAELRMPDLSGLMMLSEISRLAKPDSPSETIRYQVSRTAPTIEKEPKYILEEEERLKDLSDHILEKDDPNIVKEPTPAPSEPSLITVKKGKCEYPDCEEKSEYDIKIRLIDGKKTKTVHLCHFHFRLVGDEYNLRYPRPPSIVNIPPSMKEIRSNDDLLLVENGTEIVKGPSPSLMTIDGPERVKTPVLELSKKEIEDLLKHVGESHPPFVNVEELFLKRRREALEEAKNVPEAVKGVSDANVEVSSPKDSSGKDSS